jgi:hypothetical protein
VVVQRDRRHRGFEKPTVDCAQDPGIVFALGPGADCAQDPDIVFALGPGADDVVIAVDHLHELAAKNTFESENGKDSETPSLIH